MTRRHANPLSNPLHYSTVQPNFGPPVTVATASRNLLTYDYGKLLLIWAMKAPS